MLRPCWDYFKTKTRLSVKTVLKPNGVETVPRLRLCVETLLSLF